VKRERNRGRKGQGNRLGKDKRIGEGKEGNGME
jgi:hypothetical protein